MMSKICAHCKQGQRFLEIMGRGCTAADTHDFIDEPICRCGHGYMSHSSVKCHIGMCFWNHPHSFIEQELVHA